MNLKASFVLYSTGTEVIQESCLKICFITVGISGDEKREKQNPTDKQPEFVILKIPVLLVFRFVCKNAGKKGEFFSKFCFGTFLVQEQAALFLQLQPALKDNLNALY